MRTAFGINTGDEGSAHQVTQADVILFFESFCGEVTFIGYAVHLHLGLKS
ncbi:hypothetical protein K2173_010308 [Erythroxylum novogranatense]|uniref:Uncharacterized protein n=1 Tax=Erythroxylum novogranatense TaxID=1862640 RepID=A0AAV8TF38_9ROSI|nr:hypothetical protein K2173_010308 [Erythroxylum novogranatense]